jgi:hypothetical protein
MQTDNFANCQLGPRNLEFFERALQESMGDQFYVWWNRETDAQFYLNCALYQIWCDINWLPPATDQEREEIESALACLDKAYKLDSSLRFPAPEWRELASLAGKFPLRAELANRFGVSGKAKMGYRRYLISYRFSSWSFAHRGKMHFFEKTDEGYDISVFWDDDHTIRAQMQKFYTPDGDVPDSEVALASKLMGCQKYDRIKLSNKSIAAAVTNAHVREGKGLVWETTLYAALNGTMFILAISYQNPANKTLAQNIISSVEFIES